jgi:predicted nuclease of predicted toxin-antitoxin system
MRFLVDAQLPPALARWLVTQGHDAEHVFDCNLGKSSDRDIWDYAIARASVIVTKDEDFARRKVLDQGGPRVVWVRLSNTRRRDLLRWFEDTLSHILEALNRGETLIEVI